MALGKATAAKKKAPTKNSGLKGLLAGLKKKAALDSKADGKAAKKVEAAPPKKGAPGAKSPADAAKAGAKKADAPKPLTRKPTAKQIAAAKAAEQAAGHVDRVPGKIRMRVENRSFINDQGEAVCREVACEALATTGTYCRMHYIKNWKKIKRKELILKEKKLNQYIEELVAKYPDKYIEAIRQDLASDKDFAKVINDLDLDETIEDFDVDNESQDSVIDSIRRDFDDDGGDSF